MQHHKATKTETKKTENRSIAATFVTDVRGLQAHVAARQRRLKLLIADTHS